VTGSSFDVAAAHFGRRTSGVCCPTGVIGV
jgi:hypothetical protein